MLKWAPERILHTLHQLSRVPPHRDHVHGEPARDTGDDALGVRSPSHNPKNPKKNEYVLKDKGCNVKIKSIVVMWLLRVQENLSVSSPHCSIFGALPKGWNKG